MPTNEQRREAAKRKLQRQLERRAERARRRKQLTIAGSVIAAIVVVGAITSVVLLTKGDDSTTNTASAETTTPAQDVPAIPMPTARATALPATVKCNYPPGGAPAAKPVQPPATDNIATSPATIDVSLDTSQGEIGLKLNNAESPCTVNNFVSLAKQGFFDNTPCHRLTNSADLKVLQCGDPTGKGNGGPGYQFANEFPTDQYSPEDPNGQKAMQYKRGIIAMANAGPDTNGSQFFLVYGDSKLPPQYTVFGTIDNTGLATLDKIAKGGIAAAAPGAPAGEDGKPVLPVDIKSVKVS
ncbi:peptidylprolyl isomerase [Skermania sp. ID1734]|uniref:peptidylprolyl isomerase n=1 Tax=Skermania sp. ID1734 TaxID=2597516 RepID=UPI00117FE84C|nr:peptidylprolyl isomerase [Skermania sp. ID1734]TSD94658.1 peptidylprolyl isomerase [Skermania sp. ID1734]